MRRASLIASLAAVIACGNPTGTDPSKVTATLDSQGVLVMNDNDRPLALAALDADILALINWAQCTERTPDCLRLPARGSLHIPFSNIGAGATKIAVFVWDVVHGKAENVARFGLHR